MSEDPAESAADLIDTARYPIADLGHAACRALIVRCRAELADRQVSVVPGFLAPAALAQMAGVAEAVAAEGYRRPGLRTCYVNSDPEPDWPEDHPGRRRLVHKTRILAYDQIRGRPIDRLYRWRPLRDLLAEILGKPKLFLNGCPYQALNLIALKAGDQSSWCCRRLKPAASSRSRPRSGRTATRPTTRSARSWTATAPG